MSAKDVSQIFPRLISGDIGPALASFDDGATVDTPLDGKLQHQEWVAEFRAWLDRHHASYMPGATIVTDDRIAHECTLTIEVDGEQRELPVLLVADMRNDLIHAMRAYHSTWPLTGDHLKRGPLIDPEIEYAQEPVDSYIAAMATGDVDALEALFEKDGYVREPAGEKYKHAGKERESYFRPLRERGGVGMTKVTSIDDGKLAAIEYLYDEWAGVKAESQPGASVWERGPDGKIAAVRIYDDVTTPAWVAGN